MCLFTGHPLLVSLPRATSAPSSQKLMIRTLLPDLSHVQACGLILWPLCNTGDQSGDENITQMLKRAHDCRKTAENAAKALLMKLDGSCGGAFAVAGCSVQPWESLSSNSHTR